MSPPPWLNNSSAFIDVSGPSSPKGASSTVSALSSASLDINVVVSLATTSLSGPPAAASFAASRRASDPVNLWSSSPGLDAQ